MNILGVVVNKNTRFVKGNLKDIKELVIVLDSVINDCLETSLVQYRYWYIEIHSLIILISIQ